MTRTDIINILINKNGYKSFLEIGVCDGINQRNVKAEHKVGVDPDPMLSGEPVTSHVMTSDDFFKVNKEKFDIIFVDGLHHWETVYRDIKNGLACLNDGGAIVCHDMSPIEEIHQKVPRETRVWNGDCWKAWIKLRTKLNNQMFVVDTDWGCGVILKGSQDKLDIKEELTYTNLVKNRKEWLNLISIDNFVDMF